MFRIDEFKRLEDITKPDPWYARKQVHDPESGHWVPLTLERFHTLVEALATSDRVPEAVQGLFDRARNVFLYSWFAFPLNRTAELQAMAALESGLASRFHPSSQPEKPDGLRALLKRAIDRGLVHEDRFAIVPKLTGFGGRWEFNPAEPDTGLNLLCDQLPAFRNRLAHGSAEWSGTAFATLSACRDILDQISIEASGQENSVNVEPGT